MRVRSHGASGNNFSPVPCTSDVLFCSSSASPMAGAATSNGSLSAHDPVLFSNGNARAISSSEGNMKNTSSGLANLVARWTLKVFIGCVDIFFVVPSSTGPTSRTSGSRHRGGTLFGSSGEWTVQNLYRESEYVKRGFFGIKDVRGRRLFGIADQILLPRLANNANHIEMYSYIMSFWNDSDSSTFGNTPPSSSEHGRDGNGVVGAKQDMGEAESKVWSGGFSGAYNSRVDWDYCSWCLCCGQFMLDIRYAGTAKNSKIPPH